MSPTASRTNLAGSRGRNFIPLLLVALTAAASLLSTTALATDSSAGLLVDHQSAVAAAAGGSVGGPAAAVGSGGRFDGINDEVNDDDTPDIDERQMAALLGLRLGDDEPRDDVAKRRSKAAAFRSDLGKRGLGDDDSEDVYGTEKRAYRMRGGKAFKADLGKRARGASMFRSDLGRRSDPSLVSDPRRMLTASERAYDGLAFDSQPSSPAMGELPAAAAETEGESHVVDRRRSMFRSDLGKRSTRGESVRRMFRADLGKRRVAFRHDLG
jgi:hypothetical protein